MRAPRTIVSEIVLIALACVVGAVVPQLGIATIEELAHFQAARPMLAMLVKTFKLDHVFHSAWFLILTGFTGASLLVIVIEQIKRLRLQWSQRLTPSHFHSAPFRIEFERPARQATMHETQVEFWTEKRVGTAGSAIFHSGLLLIMLAGTWRALFGTEAVVDLVEGETLPPTAAAWAGQWPGVWAKPFQLDGPATLKSVKATHYDMGDLKDLRIQLALESRGNVQLEELAVNQDLHIAGERLFLGSDFGPTALIEWQHAGTSPIREAALLVNQGKGTFEGSSTGPSGLRAYLRTQVDSVGNHSQTVEVRVMNGNALLFTGEALVGDSLSLPNNTKLVLHGTPFWARLRGSRDSALWLAYIGFALVITGSTIIFTLVRVDGCLVITPAGERERVFLALKPQRFPLLFQERFQKLVQEQGGENITICGNIAAMTEIQSPSSSEKSSTDNSSGVAFTPTSCSLPSNLACRFLLACPLLLTSCGPSPVVEARQLVERYNQVVSEAYRRGDVRLIDPVVGPNEGRKLTGLIGVRLDLGMTLDSQLLTLEILKVEKLKTEMQVRTRERWSYRDLKIGSGVQVGEASLDNYEMLYIFKQEGKAWLVDEIRFASPPQVGRKQPTWIADRGAKAGADVEHRTLNIEHPTLNAGKTGPKQQPGGRIDEEQITKESIQP